MKRLLALGLVALWPLVSFAAADKRGVLVIVGMATEAQVATGTGAAVVLSAGNGDLLRSRLKAYSKRGIRAVVSFGIAGGLNPGLKPGDLLVSDHVVTVSGGQWTADPTLVKEIVKAARSARVTIYRGTVLGEDGTAGTDPASKAKLRQETGADLVDNESHIAADFAESQGLPFTFVRAVDDPYNRTLPPAALIPLLPDGTPNGNAIFASILADPGQIPGLWQAKTDSEAALGVLTQIRQYLDWRAL